ncbi:MAG: hypothetical protein JRH11_14650 [Deltaproteobacteria bacterium]|nr:hypothetical protein [Deltaproteobacteria bacterium]
MDRLIAGVVAGALSLALSAPMPTAACMHVIEFTKEDAVRTVARAERSLIRGDAVVAYRASRRARHEFERSVRDEGPSRQTESLIARARRITAVAVVRLDGWTPITRRDARRTIVRGREVRSLAWAAGQLRTYAEENPSDLRARSFLGEALARIPVHHDEAREILLSLADRDLMPDAHGYAALLRVVTVGTTHWNEALTRCEQMAAENAPQICPSSS